MAYLVLFQKPGGEGIAKAFSNRAVLSEYTEISYDTLTHHFTRNKEVWHYYDEPGLLIIRYGDLVRGRQRIHFKEKKNQRGKFG